ncbi:hypothetical protein ES703_124605 [subsurface metagenome]
MTFGENYVIILTNTGYLLQGVLLKMVNNNETPEERFKRIATVRTNAVLNRLRILGNLSNRQMYSYSEEDINKIFSAINKQLREVRIKFNSQKQEKFKL